MAHRPFLAFRYPAGWPSIGNPAARWRHDFRAHGQMALRRLASRLPALLTDNSLLYDTPPAGLRLRW